jgi:hypothetical protein
VRSGVPVAIGEAGATVDGASAAPASERLCDAVIGAFALWTVCANVVVYVGGGLAALLILYATALSAVLVLRRYWIGSPPPSRSSQTAELAAPSRMTWWMLGVAALVAALTLAPRFAAQPGAPDMWWSAVALLGLAAVAVCGGDGWRIVPARCGDASEMRLWLLAAVGVVIALISHRPDADDAFYVNVAVAAAEAPRQALFSRDTMHGIAALPLHLSVYRVTSYELLNGALAYLTGIPAIYCFHWLSAASAALLVPLAYARLFRILTPRYWLASVATVVCVLLAAGETPRWYGNFSFVRIWQGKAILLSVVLPLLYAYALRFAAQPNRRHWTMLAAAQIAAIGCSSSGLWLAPLSALLVLCAAVRPAWPGVRIGLCGGFASAYVLAVARVFQVELKGSMGVPAAAASRAGPQLHDVLVTVLGDSRLLVVGSAALLAAWIFAPPGLARRFAVVLPLGVLLGLLNPYTARWVTTNVTGPPYWRTLWAVPLPILLALIFTAPLHLGGSAAAVLRGAGWLAGLAAFALLVPRCGGLSAANQVRLGWPQLKVPDTTYRWALEVNARAPAGSHVAVASDIGTWIVTQPHHVYPLVVRDYLRAPAPHLSRQALRERLNIQHFLNAPQLIEAAPEQFREGLDRFDVQAVCLVNDPTAGVARSILERSGFDETLIREGYALWVRSGHAPNDQLDRGK